MQKGSPLTLCNHFIQPYRALDTLLQILLTIVITYMFISCKTGLEMTYVGYMLLGVQGIAGSAFFACSSSIVDSEDSKSLFYRPILLSRLLVV